MKTIAIIITLALTGCGVVDSVNVKGNYADYEIKFVQPAK